MKMQSIFSFMLTALLLIVFACSPGYSCGPAPGNDHGIYITTAAVNVSACAMTIDADQHSTLPLKVCPMNLPDIPYGYRSDAYSFVPPTEQLNTDPCLQIENNCMGPGRHTTGIYDIVLNYKYPLVFY